MKNKRQKDDKPKARIRPQPGPQELALASPADVLIYGGAAGGGKTYSLLMEPLRHIANPEFNAVAFRRTSPQIKNPGGLWDESSTLYPLLDAEPKSSVLEWHFPSGAKVKFAPMQHEQDKFNWQGAQIPLILWDELTHFTENQFFYMLTRNRSTSGVRPYMRATCNPDAESWVADFISWWIDQDTGLAMPERAGVLRWFVRYDEEIKWADTKEELLEKYGHLDLQPKSMTFIPASVYDNKILMKKDPGYLANLMAQPLVERERLLGGNWKVRASSGKVFNRDWFEVVQWMPEIGFQPQDRIYSKTCKDCLFWDFASTSKEFEKDDPDYTAAVWVRYVHGTFYVVEAWQDRLGPAQVEEQFVARSMSFAERSVATGGQPMIRFELEPGSAARRDARRMIMRLPTLDVRATPPRGDKMMRAKPLAAQAYAGNVKVVKGDWNEMWLTHMHHQPDWAHDDLMDATAGAQNSLVGRMPRRDSDKLPTGASNAVSIVSLN
jgi:predicted phage terminase large subunit-like protein